MRRPTANDAALLAVTLLTFPNLTLAAPIPNPAPLFVGVPVKPEQPKNLHNTPWRVKAKTEAQARAARKAAKQAAKEAAERAKNNPPGIDPVVAEAVVVSLPGDGMEGGSDKAADEVDTSTISPGDDQPSSTSTSESDNQADPSIEANTEPSPSVEISIEDLARDLTPGQTSPYLPREKHHFHISRTGFAIIGLATVTILLIFFGSQVHLKLPVFQKNVPPITDKKITWWQHHFWGLERDLLWDAPKGTWKEEWRTKKGGKDLAHWKWKAERKGWTPGKTLTIKAATEAAAAVAAVGAGAAAGAAGVAASSAEGEGAVAVEGAAAAT